VISLEKEQEMKNKDPSPNQSADFATSFHITNSTILSQRLSHPDWSGATVLVAETITVSLSVTSN
jgi:hypothetical protein